MAGVKFGYENTEAEENETTDILDMEKYTYQRFRLRRVLHHLPAFRQVQQRIRRLNAYQKRKK